MYTGVCKIMLDNGGATK